MADFNQPTNTSLYSGIWSTVRTLIASCIKLDPSSDTNIPTNAWRNNATSAGKFQKWNGSAWADADVHFGNAVGIATTSPSASHKLDVRGRIIAGSGTEDSEIAFRQTSSTTTRWNASVRTDIGGSNQDLKFNYYDASAVYQGIALQLENSGGRVFLNQTSRQNAGAENARLQITGGTSVTPLAIQGGTNGYIANFNNDSGSNCGEITFSGTTTTYSTSSDYRLKKDIKDLDPEEALADVMRYRSREWVWATDGRKGHGFVAHELQEIEPVAVSGQKDAVDENGNPIYQGVDAKFLVSKLTAVVQHLVRKNDVLEARLAALEAKLEA